MKLPDSVTSDASIVTPAPAALTSDNDSSDEPSLPAANRRPDRPAKFTVTTGDDTNPGAVPPAIVTGSVMPGRADRREIVPATENVISSAPAFALACTMASRRDPAPPSSSVVTGNVASMARPSSRSARSDRNERRLARTRLTNGFTTGPSRV